MSKKILLVEDDQHLAQLIKAYLQEGGNLVDWADTGEKANGYMLTNEYDLFILDWMLPDLTGVEICQNYRSRGGASPVILLTARGREEDKVVGLDAGADDYLVKPFGQAEFNARVRALLRRPKSFGGKILQVQDVEIDTATETVTRAGRDVELRPKEYSLLEFLMRHPGQSFTAEALIERVWQSDATTSIDAVRMHVMALRRKLGDSDNESGGGLIKNVRGKGYKISAS